VQYVPIDKEAVACARPPWCVGVKSKLVDRTRGSGKSGCPNCHLGDRCKACRLAHREKCIDDIWIDAKGPLK